MPTAKQEGILTGATRAFVRHGFRRVTMGEVARSAGMSRPALYLVFDNKEEIFRAVFRRSADRATAQIRREISNLESPGDRLRFALEVWTVRPFELVQQYPDARDLVDPPYAFVRETSDEVHREFEVILEEILLGSGPEAGHRARLAARMLAAGAGGFKARAASTRELRRLIGSAVDAALAYVGAGPRGEA